LLFSSILVNHYCQLSMIFDYVQIFPTLAIIFKSILVTHFIQNFQIKHVIYKPPAHHVFQPIRHHQSYILPTVIFRVPIISKFNFPIYYIFNYFWTTELGIGFKRTLSFLFGIIGYCLCCWFSGLYFLKKILFLKKVFSY
jgi:hypothetical protein